MLVDTVAQMQQDLAVENRLLQTPVVRQDEGGTERLCSPNMELEMAVIQLQRDVEDCRMELELARKHTPAVALQPPRRSGFTSTPVPGYSGKSNWEQYRDCTFEWLGRCHGGPTAALSSGWRCTQRFGVRGMIRRFLLLN